MRTALGRRSLSFFLANGTKIITVKRNYGNVDQRYLYAPTTRRLTVC